MTETRTLDPDMIKCLRKDFPDKQVQTKPGQGGLKYISHGSVTARLLECDPFYSYEILEEYRTNDGKNCLGVKMALTIGGHTRVEVGGTQRPGNTIVADLKNCYSDALKRCAMRFGVALAMWEDLIDSVDDDDTPVERAERTVERRSETNGTSTRNEGQTQQGGGTAPAQRVDTVEASLTSGAATQRQTRYLQAVAREAGIDAAALDEMSKDKFGVPINVLSRADMTEIIDMIQTQHPVIVAANNPQPKPEANGQTVVSSKQDESDPDSVLPTKRREDFIKAIFEHTKGQITATDLNNYQIRNYSQSLQRITIKQSRDLYSHILNASEYELQAERDEMRRAYQPITDTLRKKLFAVVGQKSPAGVESNNYLHVQLFEHLGLGSVNDMSTYDVDKMVSVYERQDFMDPEPVEPPF